MKYTVIKMICLIIILNNGLIISFLGNNNIYLYAISIVISMISIAVLVYFHDKDIENLVKSTIIKPNDLPAIIIEPTESNDTIV